MDILKQCQKWHENNEHHKIIEALEGIEERTPEMDSQLARAYNNEADHRTLEGRAMLKKAIALLKPHEEYFEGDYYWNFRMGYSYYYLDQEGRALRYFEKALEARPDDEDTMQLIDGCKKGISLPQFSECFRERTESTWKDFARQEAQLRRMMDEDKDHTRGQELVDRVEGILNQAFDEISFEMGVGGEKYELILTPEGDKVKLFELVYFQKHAPRRCWSTGTSWWAVSPSETSAFAPTMAGTSLGMMCKSGWRNRVKTASPSPPTAKSFCPCSGRLRAGSGGCSPPSPTKCWERSPICGILTISMCWKTPRKNLLSSCPSCLTS